MTNTISLKRLSPDQALVCIDHGAAYVDLRKVNEYVDVHIPASLSLQYEFGPGLAGRARDCIPLGVALVILEEEGIDPGDVAAALRGKGFTVEGVLEGGIKAWASAHGTPASTDAIPGSDPPRGTVLDIGDPAAVAPDDALRIPIERLWADVEKVPRTGGVTVVAGHGVRAALAVGILERARVQDVSFWWRRPATTLPPAKQRHSRLFGAFND